MFRDELERLRLEHLLRVINDRTMPSCGNNSTALSRICIAGQEYINFASNDYLGLAGHDAVRETAKRAIDTYGFGSGASRLLSGGTALHRELEQRLAVFKGSEAALLFNSGYAANTSILPAIAGEGAVIFSDALNHASIIDGCRLSRAKTVIYRHKDTDHLSALMQREKGRRNVVVTDTVFSMDGDIAPLKELYDLCCEYDALLYIDDAHGTGVLGAGRGALAHFSLMPESRIIQMGTCSKALGSFGAFVVADRTTIDWLMNACRGFIFSTALPAAAAAASLASLEIIQKDPSLVKRLWSNRERLLKGITALGLDTLNSATPIVPVIVGGVEETLTAAERLKGKHIYAPAIRPPTVETPRIRITVSAAHTESDIDTLLEALAAVMKS
ncbi:MAG: 8-amino-7-oxononanoate synthase [Nitrospirota bacterium]